MINLSTSSINPSFVEEVVLKTASIRCPDGGYYIQEDAHHRNWIPTQVGVVVHFASGRSNVYGGNDANTIWMHYHGVPACADTTKPMTFKYPTRNGVEVRSPDKRHQLTHPLFKQSFKTCNSDTVDLTTLDNGPVNYNEFYCKPPSNGMFFRVPNGVYFWTYAIGECDLHKYYLYKGQVIVTDNPVWAECLAAEGFTVKLKVVTLNPIH